MDTVAADYLKWDICPETRNAIQALLDSGDDATLMKLLGRRLAFGTAGLRGPMGPGYSQMNNLVIIQTMQGLLRYLEQTLPNSKSMVGTFCTVHAAKPQVILLIGRNHWL